jgi:hypothetical protein
VSIEHRLRERSLFVLLFISSRLPISLHRFGTLVCLSSLPSFLSAMHPYHYIHSHGHVTPCPMHALHSSFYASSHTSPSLSPSHPNYLKAPFDPRHRVFPSSISPHNTFVFSLLFPCLPKLLDLERDIRHPVYFICSSVLPSSSSLMGRSSKGVLRARTHSPPPFVPPIHLKECRLTPFPHK